MWPFKKHPPIESLDIDDDAWSVSMGTLPDGPMVVRKNTAAQRWAGHPLLQTRVGFAIPLNQPNPGGLPDDDENHLLAQAEDLILARLKSAGPTIQVLAITTGTFKEFVFHIQNGDAIPAVHEQLRDEIVTHFLQCTGPQHDPQWDLYASFRVNG
jgi:hypothetical protein